MNWVKLAGTSSILEFEESGIKCRLLVNTDVDTVNAFSVEDDIIIPLSYVFGVPYWEMYRFLTDLSTMSGNEINSRKFLIDIFNLSDCGKIYKSDSAVTGLTLKTAIASIYGRDEDLILEGRNYQLYYLHKNILISPKLYRMMKLLDNINNRGKGDNLRIIQPLKKSIEAILSSQIRSIYRFD